MGKASMASYRETKNYLLAKGLRSREVMDAPTTFHLRNYAIAQGVDLAPLQKRRSSAMMEADSAKLASDRARKSAKRAAEEARKAEVAAEVAAMVAGQDRRNSMSPESLPVDLSSSRRSRSSSTSSGPSSPVVAPGNMMGNAFVSSTVTSVHHDTIAGAAVAVTSEAAAGTSEAAAVMPEASPVERSSSRRSVIGASVAAAAAAAASVIPLNVFSRTSSSRSVGGAEAGPSSAGEATMAEAGHSSGASAGEAMAEAGPSSAASIAAAASSAAASVIPWSVFSRSSSSRSAGGPEAGLSLPPEAMMGAPGTSTTPRSPMSPVRRVTTQLDHLTASEAAALLAAARAAVAAERSDAVALQEKAVANALAVKQTQEELRAAHAAAEAAAIAAAHRAANEKAKAVAAAAKRASAVGTLAEIEGELTRERAAMVIQSNVRTYLQQRVYHRAWTLVVFVQKRYRSRAVRALYHRIMSYCKMLRQGEVFLKFSSDGPPHDRFVWLDKDMKTLSWCHPDEIPKEDGPKGHLKTMALRDCVEVAEGAITRTFKRSSSKRANGFSGGEDQSTLRLKLLPSLKKDMDQVFHPQDAFSQVHNANLPVQEHSCFSVVSKERSLDLVAPSNRVRDDWLWALRMLQIHWTGTTDLANVHSQRKLMGIDEDFCEAHRYRAVDLLGDEYVELLIEVKRTDAGMGIVLDAATNKILKVDPGSESEIAGLLVRDVVAVVDGTAVTVIEDGFIIPRSLVASAVNPAKEVIELSVFRPY